MLISYKTEIRPTSEQISKIIRSIGICRWLYNEYIARNKRLYKLYQRGCLDENQKHFISAYEFDKYINHNLKSREEYSWISKCGSKARKKAIINAEIAFKQFFQKKSEFPRFKKKSQQDVKVYFYKNCKGDWTIKRHWVQVPTIGKIRLKEFGYLPTCAIVKSGTVSYKAGRFYVSVLVDTPERQFKKPQGEALGIDLGIKDLAILSDGTKYKNVNKTATVRRLEKKLRREQRRLSRKLESKKRNGGESAAYFANISKNILKVQKLYCRLTSIRTNYANQVINDIVRREPSYVVIENLNVSGMMKNHHLAKAVAGCRFYEFRVKLTAKCHKHGIEIRIADRFYPSSKTCHECGYIKHDLKLSDRTYICPECGNTIDRDFQAALNLRDLKEYEIA
jgi:transposase, IS605 orfB family